MSSAALVALCATLTLSGSAQVGDLFVLPDAAGSWIAPNDRAGRTPSEPIRVEIDGVGWFDVDPAEVAQHRPDLFRPGQLSVYDLIAHLGSSGRIEFAGRYDESMETYVIDSIDGTAGWWYEAKYDSGWFERNATRIDTYPVKDGMVVRLFEERPGRLEKLYAAFAEEVERLEANGGVLILPDVEIEGPVGRLLFENVRVTPHDVRTDLWQPGTITALDVFLSLGEQGALTSVGLHWYASIGGADPVDDYFIERVEAEGFLAEASGGCGFVYEVGATTFRGFSGSHVHIPTDARALVSPEYALWFWLCL